MIEIESERLTMSVITEQDWPLFYRLYSESEIIQHCFDPLSIQEIKEKFQSRLQKWSPGSEHWLCLVIWEKNSGLQVGITGLIEKDNAAEVGYLLLPEFYGKNYATESLAALLDYAVKKLNVDRFSAVVTEGNIASERVLEKCGFKLSEVFPKAYQIAGQKRDDYVFKYFPL